jgi:hypothetical protein
MKTRPATVSGVVLDTSGQAVAQARVFFSQAPGAVPDVAALSGTDGSFTLAAPHLGRHVLTCSSDALGSTSAAVTVNANGAWVEMRLG